MNVSTILVGIAEQISVKNGTAEVETIGGAPYLFFCAESRRLCL